MTRALRVILTSKSERRWTVDLEALRASSGRRRAPALQTTGRHRPSAPERFAPPDAAGIPRRPPGGCDDDTNCFGPYGPGSRTARDDARACVRNGHSGARASQHAPNFSPPLPAAASPLAYPRKCLGLSPAPRPAEPAMSGCRKTGMPCASNRRRPAMDEGSSRPGDGVTSRAPSLG